MINLYDKNLILIGALDYIVDKNISLSKNINELNKFNITIYNTASIYDSVIPKCILEVENDYYLIDNISEEQNKKVIQATQIGQELNSIFWDNSFTAQDFKAWEPSIRISIGTFYTYNGNKYISLNTHTSGPTFDTNKFNNINSLKNNFMPDTTPQLVLTQLLAGTGWTVNTCDSFTSTDFKIEQGSVLSNINRLIEVWGGELLFNKRTVCLKERIGSDKTDIFKTGYNLTNLSITTDSTNIINKLFPYGQNGLTLITTNKYVEDLSSQALYGIRTGSVDFSEIYDPNFLLEQANKYLLKSALPTKTIQTGALKLDAETFNIGDTITLIDDDIHEDYRINSIEYNPFNNSVHNCSLSNKDINIINIFKKILKKVDNVISKVDIKLENISTTDHIINKVIDVVSQKLITAEIAQIASAFIQNLTVEKLTTNSWGRDKRNPDITEKRNYITIEDQNIVFITETLDLNGEETLEIPNPDPLSSGMLKVYYTAINDDPQAYRYYTTTPPNVLNTLIPSTDNHLYEVKVFPIKEIAGIKQSYNKMNINFIQDGNQEVQIQMGTGNGTTLKSNKFYIYKDIDSAELYMYNNTDEQIGFNIGMDCVRVKNASIPSGGGHIPNVYYGANEPAAGLGQDGDIYFIIE